jgi:hypothetical protein
MTAGRYRALLALFFFGLVFFGLGLGAANAQISRNQFGAPDSASVSQFALTYYVDCVHQAVDRANVVHLDRDLQYSCYGDTALAYFNFLGRRHVPDVIRRWPEGVFIFRRIRGKGNCWNKIADEWGLPVSLYGCAIFEEI